MKRSLLSTVVFMLSSFIFAQDNFLPPEKMYGQLFIDVQTKKVFPDSKTFVDCTPKYDVGKILNNYKSLQGKNDVQVLKRFVEENFEVPKSAAIYKADSTSINQHIQLLWNVLKRNPDVPQAGTYIPLPNPYIVPGGRFQEIYYWDSYFTMLGLQADGQVEMIQNMVDNFAYLIKKFGFIPNGNRTYYLSRSQPPFFSKMVDVLAEIKGEEIYTKYLPAMQAEYDFWMKGKKLLTKNVNASKHVVRMSGGEYLNRYWDELNTPRSESYREDVETANKAKSLNPAVLKENIYRNLRAGAESGWDYSSRWLSKVNNQFDLSTIHTTDIIPVDLNSLLFHLEENLSKAYGLKGDKAASLIYSKLASARAKAIHKYCWNESLMFYGDYNFKKRQSTNILSLAALYPLFFKIATEREALFMTKTITEQFLREGGLVATPNFTHQQWDAPNGWAPLQWISIVGLRNYGHTDLANECKNNWLKNGQKVYNKYFKLTEKYDVVSTGKEAGGGEYVGQDGFGWTNGVYQKLSKE